MAKIRGYMAASLDGYIADKDGGVDWLDPFSTVDCGYDAFYGDIRTVVMGRKTYDQVRSFDENWVYAGRRGIVVTATPLHDPPEDVAAWPGTFDDLVSHLRNLDDGDVWVVGGAQLQSALLTACALDRLQLFIIPVLLGEGIPLFQSANLQSDVRLDAIQQFDQGIVGLTYNFDQS